MLIRCSLLLSIVLLISNHAEAQTWEPAATASFAVLAGAMDGSLLLVRLPGDILRSTDTGAT